MKLLLPVLGGLAVLAAAWMRSGVASEPAFPAPRPTPVAPFEAETVGVRAEEKLTPTRIKEEPLGTSTTAASAKGELPVEVPTPWALLGRLDRSLRLTPLQKRAAEEIFRERNRKVEEYGLEVARRGWAHPRDYDLRVGALREASYRSLAAILDSEQAAAFAREVAAGMPDDDLSIEIPEGVVKLD